MTKDEAVGWLFSNYSKFDFSMLSNTLKVDFTDAQFLSWCAIKKDLERKNRNHPDWAKFRECLSIIKDYKEKAAQEQIERQTLREIIRRKQHIAPELKTFSMVEIAEHQKEKYLDICLRGSISSVISSLQKIQEDYPNAELVKVGYDYEYQDLRILIGYELFEETKLRLEERAKLDYENHLKKYNQYLELIKKYPELNL